MSIRHALATSLCIIALCACHTVPANAPQTDYSGPSGSSGHQPGDPSPNHNNAGMLLKSTVTGIWSGSMQLTPDAIGGLGATRPMQAGFGLPTLIQQTTQASQALTGSFTINAELRQYADKIITGSWGTNLPGTGAAVTTITGTGSTEETVTVTVHDGPYIIAYSGTVSDHVYSGEVSITTEDDQSASGTFTMSRQYSGRNPPYSALELRLHEPTNDDFDFVLETPDGYTVFWNNPQQWPSYLYNAWGGLSSDDLIYFNDSLPSGGYNVHVVLWGTYEGSSNNVVTVEVRQYGVLMATPIDQMALSANFTPDSWQIGDSIGGRVATRFVNLVP